MRKLQSTLPPSPADPSFFPPPPLSLKKSDALQRIISVFSLTHPSLPLNSYQRQTVYHGDHGWTLGSEVCRIRKDDLTAKEQ